MPQKIKKLTNSFIDFVFNNWLKIAIVFLTLAWLFLFGHVFGINQQISEFSSWLIKQIWENKINVINVFLAIGSTISAIFAVVISVRANRISKIALESERPIIEFYFDGNNFSLSNNGNSDATNLVIMVKPTDRDFFVEIESLNLTAGIKNFKIPFNLAKKYILDCSVVIVYQNPITKENYMLGYIIKTQTSGFGQIDNSNNNLLKYNTYLDIYKSLRVKSLQEIIRSFIH